MFINYIKKFFNTTHKSKMEQYLEESVDMVDLENRIRQLDRGQAPFQIYERNYQNIFVSH